MFFGKSEMLPMSLREVKWARELCADCPVISHCLEAALLGEERWGVWGGTTPPERERALALHDGDIDAVMDEFLDGTLMDKVVKRRGGG